MRKTEPPAPDMRLAESYAYTRNTMTDGSDQTLYVASTPGWPNVSVARAFPELALRDCVLQVQEDVDASHDPAVVTPPHVAPWPADEGCALAALPRVTARAGTREWVRQARARQAWLMAAVAGLPTQERVAEAAKIIQSCVNLGLLSERLCEMENDEAFETKAGQRRAGEMRKRFERRAESFERRLSEFAGLTLDWPGIFPEIVDGEGRNRIELHYFEG